MKRICGILFVLLAPAALAACFTSNTPLIGAEEAVFPYETIVFRAMDRPDDRAVWKRDGNIYGFFPGSGDEKVAVRLKSVGDDLFVVQMQGPDDEPAPFLYALLKVDRAAMTAESHAAIRPHDFNDMPGLSRCNEMVCIDDLNAYVAYAREQMEAGVPPFVVYKITSLE